MKEDGLRIFLDIDNVMCNWSGHACQTMGHNPLDEPLHSRLQSQETVNGILHSEDLWKAIGVAGPKWWATIPTYPWSRKLWHVCRLIAPTSFLSMPANEHGTDIFAASAAGKIQWIRENFATDNFFLGVHKDFTASPNHLLIDDNTDNCNKFRLAGGYAFHWPNPWKLMKNHTWNTTILNLIGYIEFVVTPPPMLHKIETDAREKIKIMQTTLRKMAYFDKVTI